MRKYPSVMAPLVLLGILLLFTLVLLLPRIEADSGRPFTERATVKSRSFVAKHTIYTGKMFMTIPDTWTFEVAGENAQGQVKVPQELYESIVEGDTLTVSGTRGTFTKKWYLESASKDS